MAGEKVRHFDSAVLSGCRSLGLLVGKEEGHPETAEQAAPHMLSRQSCCLFDRFEGKPGA